MRSFLPVATLLGTAFLLGCQEQASSPVGPEGLGILVNKKGPHPHGGDGGKALLFKSLATSKDADFDCDVGATGPGQGSFGKVSWAAVFSSDVPVPGHVHFKLELKGVTKGDYTIVGTQFKTTVQDIGCQGENVDITTGQDMFTVTPNGRGSLRTEFILPKHSPGESKVWVKVSGPGGVFRSPAFTIVMREHTGPLPHN